jgi:putative FmdB family regulatory protein
MVVYAYRCAEHGVTEVSRPIASAPPGVTCPVSGQAAARIYTVPGLPLGSSARRTLIDHTERTRDEPAVVSTPPPRPGPAAVARPPGLRRLPRP